MNGYYRMRRGWLEHPALRGEPYDRRSAWMWLIEEAGWKDRRQEVGGRIINLKRGQLSHSTRFMAKAWGWSEARVRRFLTRLKTDAMIDAGSDAGQNLITICNYEKYQGGLNESDTPSDAPSDAVATQQRRKHKEGKEGKKDNQTTNYAFSGKIIRLTHANFDTWAVAYSNIDLRAQLQSLDDWYDCNLTGGARKKWYERCSQALAKKNERARAEQAKEPQFNDGVY